MNTEHLVFQTDGTRYDLVLVDDPYGGVLVVWPATGYLWRWFGPPANKLQDLNEDNNYYDGKNILHELHQSGDFDYMGEGQ